MRFRFKNGEEVGVSLIDYYQLCWYDMNKDGRCYDEDCISANQFRNFVIDSLDCDQNEGDPDRTRLFVWTKNKEVYELRLHKISPEQWEKCSTFYGGRDN